MIDYNEDKRIYTGTEILKMEMKDDLWLWNGLLPTRGIACLAGASDCGKSTLARELAISIAIGKKEFLGQQLNVRRGKVIYISTEDDVNGTNMVLKKQSLGLGIDSLDNVKFIFDVMPINELEKVAGKEKVDLIIMDSLADWFTGNSNDLYIVRGVMRSIKFLSKRYDCCVLLLHHTLRIPK